MTLQDLLSEGKHFLKKCSPTSTLDAELLLTHVTDLNNVDLILKADIEIDKDTIGEYRQLLEDRKRGVPVPYLTHKKEFYGRTFFVDKKVLIPRPETEEIVEYALEWLSENPQVTNLVDIGTGSGAIGISIALESPPISVLAIDISTEALIHAQKNADNLHCKNIKLLKSDLLEQVSLPFPTPTVIIANLPYIGTETHNEIHPNTKLYEPEDALFSGLDGLDHYRRLFKKIQKNEENIKAIFLEMGSSQGEDLSKLAKKEFPNTHICIRKDVKGLERFIIIVFED